MSSSIRSTIQDNYFGSDIHFDEMIFGHGLHFNEKFLSDGECRNFGSYLCIVVVIIVVELTCVAFLYACMIVVVCID